MTEPHGLSIRLHRWQKKIITNHNMKKLTKKAIGALCPCVFRCVRLLRFYGISIIEMS